MQEVSDKLLQQFVGCIESQFAPPVEPEPVVEPAPTDAGGAPPAVAPVRRPAGIRRRGAGLRCRRHAASQKFAPAAPRPLRPPPPPAPAADDSIDLGTTVLPVLVKNYAPYAVAALAGLVLGWLLGRRRS